MLQILVWGGSFFLMAVMADPISRDTGWPSQWVYGALSLSLMVSALVAPWSSRLIARYGGRPQMAASGAVVAVGLLIMGASHALAWFLVAWAVIGIGMAMGLYEALFATLGGLYGEGAGKAITGITLIAGFASTLSWPAVALGIEHIGWRATCVCYALVLLVVVAPLYWRVLPEGGRVELPARSQAQASTTGVQRSLYLMLTSMFAIGAIIMTAIAVQLVAVLRGLGHSLPMAIGLAAMLGPSQVASRVLQILAGKRHPIWTALAWVSLVLAGLLMVAFVPAATAVGLLIFGCGNGLRAIVRGLLPLALMPPDQYVLLMGRMSRPALIGQAVTPVVGGFLFEHYGAIGLLLALILLALTNVLLVVMVMRRVRHQANGV
ncbi:MFS transporter [Pseudomonas promysalinigenes]|uniref:MFS transporter n=1 Tax=Pseudomonas promysalinigenes TaxID=485898 RepID=A0ABY6ATC7_9PSED|nr:MFS transporter [Pseudomonas promysalinigenes]UXH42307.1 MFS transporter [Pseudomonas promysalinigenes]